MADNITGRDFSNASVTLATKEVAAGVHAGKVFPVDATGNQVGGEVASSGSITTANLNPGVAATANSAVVLALNGQSSASIQITGTWVGTLQFEATDDNINWLPINGIFAGTSIPGSTITANGLVRLTPGALAQIRIVAPVFTSGTATITMKASAAVGGTFLNQSLTAGSNVIGKVGIDQTTPGTTNRVDVGVCALPTGAATEATLAAINNDNTATGSITTQNLVPAGVATANSAVEIILQGKSGLGIQVTGTYTGALSVQATVDGTTWITLGGIPFLNINTGVASATIPSAATGIWTVDVAAFAKARMTGLAAMTGTAVVTLRASNGASQIALDAALPTGGNTIGGVNLNSGPAIIGDVGTSYRTTTTGAASMAAVMSPAVNAALSIKATAGRLLGWSLQNSAASLRSVKVFNVAAPTLGTTAASFEIDIPAGGRAEYNMEGGIAFSTAMVVSVSSAKGLTDNTGTVALNDVSGVILFA